MLAGSMTLVLAGCGLWQGVHVQAAGGGLVSVTMLSGGLAGETGSSLRPELKREGEAGHGGSRL